MIRVRVLSKNKKERYERKMAEIFQNLQQFILRAIEQVQGLSPWLAAAGAVIFGLMFAFGSEQSSQFAKSRGTKMVFGLIIIWAVSAVVNTLIQLAGPNSNVNKISIGMAIDLFRVSTPKITSFLSTLV